MKTKPAGARRRRRTASGEGTRVGLVSDVGRFNDRSFNQSALEGLQRAEDELGITGRPVESRQTSDYVPSLGSPCPGRVRPDDRCRVSLGRGAQHCGEAVHRLELRDHRLLRERAAVREEPQRAGPDLRDEREQLHDRLPRRAHDPEAGRQAGDQRGRRIKLPTVDIFIAGYQAGAKQCVPGTVLIGYSQDFVAQDKCKEIALNQIAQGSQVIFRSGRRLRSRRARRGEAGDKWGIGVDRDQSSLGPHILTSAVKRVDQSVFLASKSVVDGEFKGGTDAVFDLENEGVGIGKTSPEVPQEFIDRMDEIKDRLISGELKAPSTL